MGMLEDVRHPRAREQGGMLEAWVAPRALADACRVIRDSYPARLLTMLGTDERARHGTFRLHLIFSLGDGRTLDLGCEIAPESPSYASITAVLPAAAWHEREILDLLGLVPVGHPEPRSLIRHDCWPADYYPLRKDASSVPVIDASQSPAVRDRPGVDDTRSSDRTRHGSALPAQSPDGDAPTLTIGPLPEGVGGPALLRAATTWDELARLEIRLFYAHRGAEKLCEGQTTEGALEIVERVCGACSVANTLAYCHALEAIAGIAVSLHAQVWRAVFLELERLRAHIGDTGIVAAAAGRSPIERRCAVLQEQLLGLNRAFTGMRHPRGLIVPGGLRRDLPPEAPGPIAGTLSEIRTEWQEIETRLVGDRSLGRRMRGLGALQAETVEAMGVVGPPAWAAGIGRDSRLEHPQAAYLAFPPTPITRTSGDAEGRMLVRLASADDSFRLLDGLLGSVPGGTLAAPLGPLPDGSHGLGRAESARGENLCWLSIGPGGLVERLHLRAASYYTWPAVPAAAEGCLLEDLPLLIASFGLCVACVDR